MGGALGLLWWDRLIRGTAGQGEGRVREGMFGQQAPLLIKVEEFDQEQAGSGEEPQGWPLAPPPDWVGSLATVEVIETS